MRLGIEKKILNKTPGSSSEFFFTRIFQMDQRLLVSNDNERVSLTGKSRQMILFY